MNEVFFIPKQNRAAHIILQCEAMADVCMIADIVDGQKHIMVIEIKFNREIKQGSIICRVDSLFEEAAFLQQTGFQKHS